MYSISLTYEIFWAYMASRFTKGMRVKSGITQHFNTDIQTNANMVRTNQLETYLYVLFEVAHLVEAFWPNFHLIKLRTYPRLRKAHV